MGVYAFKFIQLVDRCYLIMKTAFLLIIILLIPHGGYGYGIEEISLVLDAWSYHSTGGEVNEHHHMKGFCLTNYCRDTFINSFNRPCEVYYYMLDFSKEKDTALGFKMSVITGYEALSPLIVPIPYVGVKMGPLWTEFTFIPTADKNNNYLIIIMFRLVIFRS